jgi:hypothetical protein
MSYIVPEQVISPKQHWELVSVVLDQREGGCAYALGYWDSEKCIGFRWNGTSENPIGNPQSRGLPTWTILDPQLHAGVIQLLSRDQQMKARRFFGKVLTLEGTSVSDDQTSLGLWNFAVQPPIVAVVACDIVRKIAGDPKLTVEQCRLVVERNKELIEDISTEMFERGAVKLNKDATLRVIEIQFSDLESLVGRFSTSILQMAALSGWGQR